MTEQISQLSPTREEHNQLKERANELLNRVQVVELELQFSKRELEETRQLYKKLEELFRDSEQMIGRLSTLISVQEEVIKHLQDSIKQKATGRESDIEDLKNAIQELDRFKYKALGVIIAVVTIAQLAVYLL